MKPEIIKALKENTSAFGLMPKELQEAARKIGKTAFEVYECAKGDDFVWKFHVLADLPFTGDRTYRLHPDNKPEPEFEKIEIKVDNTSDHARLYVMCPNKLFLHKVMSLEMFSRFETDEGAKIHLEDIANYIHNGGKVYVVMRKTE